MTENGKSKRDILIYNFQSESLETYIQRLEDSWKEEAMPLTDHQKVDRLLETLDTDVSYVVKNSIRLTYDDLKEKVKDVIRKNASLNRYKFLNRKQQVGETISHYFMCLQKLIDMCQYPSDTKEILLRDTFIAGIQSRDIAGKLLLENEISLSSAVTLAADLEMQYSRDIQHANSSEDQPTVKSTDDLDSNDEKQNNSHTQSNVKSKIDASQPASSANSPNDQSSTKEPQANIPQVNEMETAEPQANADENSSASPTTDVTLPLVTRPADTAFEISSLKLPLYGKQTECFEVKFSGKSVKQYCTVTLEWHGDEHLHYASLSITPRNQLSDSIVLDLSDVTCIMDDGQKDVPFTVSLPTVENIKENKSPLILFSNSEQFIQFITTVWERVHGVLKLPGKRSIHAITEKGDLYVAYTDLLRIKQSTLNGHYLKEYSNADLSCPFRVPLSNGCTYETEITVSGFVHPNADGFHVNLICGHNKAIALHFNPRFNEQVVVRNSYMNDKWGKDERGGGFCIERESAFILTISCLKKKFQIVLNGSTYIYEHRVPPKFITDIKVEGEVNVDSILYESKDVILDARDLLWKKVRSGVCQVESCSGVKWSMDLSGTATPHLSTAPSLVTLKDFSLSVPDGVADGEIISAWAIDTSGKVLYRHGVTQSNPNGTKWEYISSKKHMISISCRKNIIWCCSKKGTCYRRTGVTLEKPTGKSWWPFSTWQRLVFKKVTVGKWAVWALDEKGDLFVKKNPSRWYKVLNEDDNQFVSIYASEENIWGVTKKGVICRRLGISADVPEGVSWSYGLSGNWIHVSE